jgi:hypothetical protein
MDRVRTPRRATSPTTLLAATLLIGFASSANANASGVDSPPARIVRVADEAPARPLAKSLTEVYHFGQRRCVAGAGSCSLFTF